MLGFKDYVLKRPSPQQTQEPAEQEILHKNGWKPSKDQIIKHWQSLEPDQELQIHAIPQEHEGSTYLRDTIRLTGTRPFIDSVLSRLKDLLEYESDENRLRIVYRETRDRVTGKPTGYYSCYIQIWQR